MMNSENGNFVELDESKEETVNVIVALPVSLLPRALDAAQTGQVDFSSFVIQALRNALPSKAVGSSKPDEQIDVLALAVARATAKSPKETFTAHALLSPKERAQIHIPSLFGKKLRTSLEEGKIAVWKGRNHQNIAVYERQDSNSVRSSLGE